ncbi:MAG: EAL domain-containing protein [Candidatus Sulfotelmatobacter sp.]
MQLRNVDGREWWLWGFAIAVTLGLTFGIVSLTFPGLQWPTDELHSTSLKEWVRALAALVLLFDIYTVYQHLQLQRMRRRLSERERLFHLITENAADMIAVVDRQGHRLYNSPAYQKVLGYTVEELAATSSLEQVHPDDRDRVMETAQKAYRTGRGDRLEYRIRHKDGTWRVLESTASAIPGRNGEIEGLIIVNRDITERKQAEALLAHQAFHDGLTSLPNRALLLDRMQRALAVSRRHPDFRFAVLFIDIDNFKVFNDSLGRAAGDELLIQIARRLSTCLRGADTVSRGPQLRLDDSATGDNTLARPGGDEFVVLASELRDPSDAIRMSKRIQERLSEPFAVNGREIIASASIGIVFSSPATTDSEAVLRDAEIAMYRAKKSGNGHCEVFDGAMHADAMGRLQLETDLRKALESDEFRVHYQPIVSCDTGRIVGFEALSRWQRSQGLANPAEFIPVACEIGLIVPMNRHLLKQACEQLKRWQSLFPSETPLTVSVNVTATEFALPDLAQHMGQTIQESGVDPACITCEITENVAMADVEHSLRTLSQLRDLGVRLSLDDFGTGLSSLYRLRQFPFHSLKIDRSFIATLDESATREIVRTIVMLSHNLDLKVVAEGIEEAEQFEILKQFGCEMAQGYLFARPVDAAAAEHLLAAQDKRTGRESRTSKDDTENTLHFTATAR